MDGDNVEVKNVVGTGDFSPNDEEDYNIAVDVLAEELEPETWVNETPHPGLHMRVDNSGEEGDSPLTTFYRSGKYIIRAGTIEKVFQENEKVIDELLKTGFIDEEREVDFYISNIVCVADMESRVNLEALALALELDKVEYESEEFPALIYRDPDKYECTFLVFANGSVVIPGGTDVEEVRESFEEFSKIVEMYLFDDEQDSAALSI